MAAALHVASSRILVDPTGQALLFKAPGTNCGWAATTGQAASWHVCVWAAQLPGHSCGDIDISCPVLDMHRYVTVWVPAPQFDGAVQAVVPVWMQP